MYKTLKEALKSIRPSDIGKASQDFKFLFKKTENRDDPRLREEYPIFFVVNQLIKEYNNSGQKLRAKMLLTCEKVIRILIDIAEQKEYFELKDMNEILTQEEIDYIKNNQKRCTFCGHLWIFHEYYNHNIHHNTYDCELCSEYCFLDL